MKKRALSLLMALALTLGLATPAFADEEYAPTATYTSGHYGYRVNEDGSATIVSFNRALNIADYSLETLTIPAKLDGHPVTVLNNYAFSNDMPAGIKTVIIPEGVTRIEDNAFLCPFADATITSVSLPSTLTHIGDSAFSAQTAIQTLVIPENVKFIGNNAFFTFEPSETRGLKTVICYSKDVEFQIKGLGVNCFSSCRNTAFYGYPGSTLEALYNRRLLTTKVSIYNEDTGTFSHEERSTGNTFEDIANAPVDGRPALPPAAKTGEQLDKWALELVNQAIDAGLMPGHLKGTDLRQNITRTQFADLAVTLYEAMSGETVQAPGENPFTDTDDEAVLKAYAMGFTSGVSATEFGANQPLTREAAATMLAAVYKKMDGVIDAEGASAFADDSSISGWAKDNVYFMAQNGIIAGVGNNNFAPKAMAQSQAALIIALRMFQNL